MTTRTVVTLLAIALIGGSLFYFMSEDTARRTIRDTSEPVKIVAFGDSLTEGYGVEQSESYPYLLSRALSYDHKVTMVNQGVSGDTTADARFRIEEVIDQKPDVVIIGLGGNDALRLLPVEKAKENIKSIIEILQGMEKPPRILLLQMQAGTNGGFEYKKQFDQMYPDLAKAYNIPLVPFIITKIYLDPAYMLPDRIHMNAAGYKYIVDEYLKEAVEKEIQKIR